MSPSSKIKWITCGDAPPISGDRRHPIPTSTAPSCFLPQVPQQERADNPSYLSSQHSSRRRNEMTPTPMSSQFDEKNNKQPLLPRTSTGAVAFNSKEKKSKRRFWRRVFGDVFLFVLSAAAFDMARVLVTRKVQDYWNDRDSLEQCSWNTLQSHVSLLDVPPITRKEFLTRQSILAANLEEAGVDAFIAEPSASSTYYVNISSSYELSERPFLMILDKKGQFSYLAPNFELNRIGALDMVYKDKTVIGWSEEESPFQVLKRTAGYDKIMLDEHARYFIATGLAAAGIETIPASKTVTNIRAVKTEAELALLRGINEYTLELIRSMQKCIKIGMTQEYILSVVASLFTMGGVGPGKGYWAIVLLGNQAANPHGGSHGKALNQGEFVLTDVGSSLHGYGSDVTRTFLPVGSKVSKELEDIWYLVRDAQSAAFDRMTVNETCSEVDAASRAVIAKAGYGPFFTHRLGHGLGLEVHEHPYLNGVNSEKLKAGHVCSNEPGIYVTNEEAKKLSLAIGFGVRLEDAVLVTANGGVSMSGSRAQSPYEP